MSFWNDAVVAKYGRMLTDDEHIDHMYHLIQEAVAGDLASVDAAMLEVAEAQEAAKVAQELAEAARLDQERASANSLGFAVFLILGVLLLVVYLLAERRLRHEQS